MSEQPTAAYLPTPAPPSQGLATEEFRPDAGGAVAGHMIQLNGIRALAVLMVLLSHTIPTLRDYLNLGQAGVRLFFVLSGFLITGILLRAKDQARAAGEGRRYVAIAFYARRFLRIFPLYYAVLFAAALVGLPQVRETFLWHLAYLSNYYMVASGTFAGRPIEHLWSLSVEEQFYLVWPAVLLLTPRRLLVPVLLLTILAGPVSRTILIARTHNYVVMQFVTSSCLDSLGMGALMAALARGGDGSRRLRLRLRAVNAVGGLILIASFVFLRASGTGYMIRDVFGFLAQSMLAAWLVDRAALGFGGLGKAIFEFRPVVYLGTISYGVYVYHDFVPVVVPMLGHLIGFDPQFPMEGGILRFLYVTSVTLTVAAASWHGFEKPLNDLKDRFPYVRRRHTAPTDLCA